MRPDTPTTSRLIRLALVALAVGLLAHTLWVLFTTDRAVLHALPEFRARWLLLAAGLTFVPWFTNTARTLIWTRFLGLRLSSRDAFTMVLATDLGSAVTPTAAGGGYVKVAMLVQRGLPAGQAASLMILGSIEDATFFLLAIPVALTLSGSWDLPVVQAVGSGLAQYGPWLGVLAIAITLVPLWLMTRRRKGTATRGWRAMAADFRGAWRLIARNGKSRFAATVALTAVQWTCRYSVLTALLAALGLGIDPVQVFVLQWMVFTLTTFIPTPGGAGGAEAAFAAAYDAMIPEGLLALVASGWRFLTFYLLLCGAAALVMVLQALAGSPPRARRILSTAWISSWFGTAPRRTGTSSPAPDARTANAP